MKVREVILEGTIKIDPPGKKAQAWIDKIYAKFPVWPLDDRQRVMVWGTGDEQQFAAFELEPSMTMKDAVEVKWFQAYPQRQGVGTKAMKALTDLAQQDGITLTLYPWDKGRVSQAALKRFYKRSGFKPVAKGGASMYWEPLKEDSGYKEIEFVCVNPHFPSATNPKLQEKMYHALLELPGVVPLRQDWSDMSDGQTSLSAIYKDPAVRTKILSIAKQLGVQVDLEQDVSDEYVDRAIRGEHEGQVLENEEEQLLSVNQAKAAIPQILAAAQRDYDNWNESDQDTYAGGGICHIIADSICDVLWKIGVYCTPVSCTHEQHVYVAAKFEEGVFTIDIPYVIYETGGGFSWKKIPDVKFEPSNVVFYKVSSDPDEFDNYVGLDENFNDGKKPGRKGLAKRMGVDCKQPVSRLRSIAANSSGERSRMAHWCANMKAGRQK